MPDEPGGIESVPEDEAEPVEPQETPVKPSKRSLLKDPTRRRSARASRWRTLLRNPLFEPVLTVVVIAIVLGGMYAYTQNWPPLVVVVSSSMQHGSEDVPGLINTGDLVLVQKVDAPTGVVTYVEAEAQSAPFQTYGENGDVIIYFANGNAGATPIIHRALVWLSWDPEANTFLVPSLGNLTCGPHGDYQVVTPPYTPENAPCPSDPDGPLSGVIYLYHVGWQSVTVTISLIDFAASSPHSGFITMGDNNFDPGTGTAPGTGITDEADGITSLVEPSWIEGVARGMIPWFGAIKLLLTGDTYYVSSLTWDYLAAAILVILLVPTLLPRGIAYLRQVRRERREEPPGSQTEDPRSPEETAPEHLDFSS